ncbi:DsbA family protein [Candidatus Binatia bacterium]|nr:DsbA family protein [Candidatus Binatia bacterium]
MRGLRSWALWVALCATSGLAACEPVDNPNQPTDAVRQHIEKRVPEYFRKKANLPDSMGVRIVDVRPSAEVPGILSASMELSQNGQTQKYPIVLSRDGRYVLQGKWGDVGVDPYEDNRNKIALAGAPVRGNPEAPVTIVEYVDLQCPYCARAHRTLEDEVLKNYGDRVRLVVKHMPIASIHPWAENAALAAVCARQQNPDGFWKLYDFFFKNQSGITADNLRQKAVGAAKDAGLDTTRFEACFDERGGMAAIGADLAEAQALGIQSTPTFFVNGRRLEGALPFDTFKTAIDAALAAVAPTPSPKAG